MTQGIPVLLSFFFFLVSKNMCQLYDTNLDIKNLHYNL